MGDDDQAERVRQQMLADLEKERQDAVRRAQEADNETKQEQARRDAEAAATLADMEAKSTEERNK